MTDRVVPAGMKRLRIRRFGSVRRARFQLTAATAIIVAALVVGCGAGKTPVRSVAVAPTTNPYRGRDYPAKFEVLFLSSCEESSRRQCVCELAYVEAHVMHQVVVQEIRHSLFVRSAAFQRATQTCKRA